MAYDIWPSYNDVFNTYADNTDRGLMFTEYEMAQIFHKCAGYQNGVISGCEISNPSGLNIQMAPGVAFLGGRLVTFDSTLSTTANGTYDEYIYLYYSNYAQLTTPTLSHSALTTTDVKNRNYLRLAKVEASGGSISALTDERDFLPGSLSGSYVGDGTTARFILADIGTLRRVPAIVFISTEGTGYESGIYSMSSIEACGNRRAANYLSPNARIWFSQGKQKNTFRVLTGNTTWNFTMSWSTGPQSQDITVYGVRAGDEVLIRHSDVQCIQWGNLFGFVNADDTVRAISSPIYNIGSKSISGTVYARVLRRSSHLFDVVNFDTSTNSEKTPLIRTGGFEVSASATDPSLNTLSTRYNYLALI